MVPVSRVRLTQDEIRGQGAGPVSGLLDHVFWSRSAPGQATEIWLEKARSKLQRVFNPYTGEDIGRAVAYRISIVAWCNDLHTNLLGGAKGRTSTASAPSSRRCCA